MSARSPELHESALSPPEYRAFSKYFELLLVQDGQPAKAKAGTTIQKSTMKDFACSRLGMSDRAVDEILFRMPANIGKLSQGEVYAVLRLLAHAQSASKSTVRAKQPVDMEMAFVPMDPLPLLGSSPTKPKLNRPLPPPLPPKPSGSSQAGVPSTSPTNAAHGKAKPPVPPRASPSNTPTRHAFPSPMTEAAPPKPRTQARMSLGNLTTMDKAKNPFRDISTQGTTDDAEEDLIDTSDEEERRQAGKARSWSTSAALSQKALQPLAPPIPANKPALSSPAGSVTNNPFRQRLEFDSRSAPSSVVSSAKSSAPPPPLPPRRGSSVFSATSPAPHIPPRPSNEPTAAYSSASSIHTASSRASPVKQPTAGPPSSHATPSPIMKQSLLAAKDARKTKMSEDGTLVQVIRRSSDASLLGPNGTGGSGRLTSAGSSTIGTIAPSAGSARSKTWKTSNQEDSITPSTPAKHNRSLSLGSESPGGSTTAPSAIAQVTEALRQQDLGDVPLPPPRRRQSTRTTKHFQQLVRPYLAEDPSTKVWSCASFLTASSKRPSTGGAKINAVIVLNQPITRKDVFIRVWNACELRYCADGGANRLFDVWGRDEASRSTHLPTMIKGDLDSLRPEVRAYYESHGVPVRQDRDEYSTDLMKCMKELETVEKSTGRTYDLILAGGLSGRLDQTVHTMSLLHRIRKERDGIMVVSEDTVAWVLDTGKHAIEIDHSTMGQTCGILPVGVAKAFVTTTGLKWNLDWSTSFDGDVSTSNHLVPGEDLVHITTDAPIWWCIEIKQQLDSLPERRESHAAPQLGLPKQEDFQRGFKELGAGVARVAEGVGKELEWLKGGRGGRRVGRGVKGDKERLVDSDDEDDEARPLGEGYRML